MSLINEALKQARSQTQERDGTPPSAWDYQPLPATHHSVRKPGGDLLGVALIFAIMVFFILGTAGLIYYVHHQRTQRARAAETAAQKRAELAAHAAERDAVTVPAVAPAAPEPPPVTMPTVSSPATTPTPATPEAPLLPLAEAAAKARTVAEAVNERAQEAALNSLVPPATAPTTAPRPAAATTTATAAADRPSPPAVTQPTAQERERKLQALRQQYRLTGIIQSGASRMALINGFAVRTGHTLETGVVVREIRENSLDIETPHGQLVLQIATPPPMPRDAGPPQPAAP